MLYFLTACVACTYNAFDQVAWKLGHRTSGTHLRKRPWHCKMFEGPRPCYAMLCLNFFNEILEFSRMQNKNESPTSVCNSVDRKRMVSKSKRRQGKVGQHHASNSLSWRPLPASTQLWRQHIIQATFNVEKLCNRNKIWDFASVDRVRLYCISQTVLTCSKMVWGSLKWIKIVFTSWMWRSWQKRACTSANMLGWV